VCLISIRFVQSWKLTVVLLHEALHPLIDLLVGQLTAHDEPQSQFGYVDAPELVRRVLNGFLQMPVAGLICLVAVHGFYSHGCVILKINLVPFFKLIEVVPLAEICLYQKYRQVKR